MSDSLKTEIQTSSVTFCKKNGMSAFFQTKLLIIFISEQMELLFTWVFIFKDSLSPCFLGLTCHCCLGNGEEKGHRVFEAQTEDDVGIEQGQGEHQEGGRHVDEVVNTEGDHQSKLYSY